MKARTAAEDSPKNWERRQISLAPGLPARLELPDAISNPKGLGYGLVHIILSRVAYSSVGESPKSHRRIFRMVMEIDTNALMMFGKTEAQKQLMTAEFGPLELKVTFEIIASKMEQRVLLLEHAYSTVSARYNAPVPALPLITKPISENPIQRAYRWKRIMGENGLYKQIAEQEGVSLGLVSQVLSLLDLPQVIVDFLKDGRDRSLDRKISLRELQRLQAMAPADAITWFRARISGQPLQGNLDL